MTRFVLAGALLVLVNGVVACDDSPARPPIAPTSLNGYAPAPTPAAPTGVGLFGRVIERTEAEDRPLGGVLLYCDACGIVGHTFVTTDLDGSYRFSGDLEHGGGIWIGAGLVQILVEKAGYAVPNGQALPPNPSYPEGYFVTVPRFDRDTEFNIVMVKKSE